MERAGTSVGIALHRKEWDYPLAHVGNDPGEPLRQKSLTAVSANADRRLSAWATLEAMLTHEIHSNRAEDFAYRGLQLEVGITGEQVTAACHFP